MILPLTRKQDFVYLRSGEILNNRWGSFHHNDVIGQPFGATWKSKQGMAWPCNHVNLTWTYKSPLPLKEGDGFTA